MLGLDKISIVGRKTGDIIEPEDLAYRAARLGLLGVDEISLLEGHSDFVTVWSAPTMRQENPIVLAVLKGREKEPLVAVEEVLPQAKIGGRWRVARSR